MNLPRTPCGVRPLRCKFPALFLLLLPLAAPAQQPDEQGWIPFADGHHVPAIEVEVNGENTVALIDTAVSVNALSNEFANRAGIASGPRSISVRDVHDGEQLPVSGAFTMELAGSPVELDRSVVMPIEGYGLVLGRPLLNALVVQIDYPGRKIRLLPPDSANFEGNVRIKRGRHHQPMVRTRIDGKTAWLTLDTSNDTFSLLAGKFVGRRGLAGEPLDPEAFKDSGVPVWPDARLLRLNQLSLGPFKIQGVVAATPDGPFDEDANPTYGARRIHENTGSDGVLGYEILRNFVVTLSLDRDEAHLYPP